VGDLHNNFGLKLDRRIARALTDLAAGLDERNIGEIMRTGVHEFIDRVQLQLGILSKEMHRGFFASH